MPVYPPTPRVANRTTATMQAFGTSSTTQPVMNLLANVPSAPTLAQGTAGNLTVTWANPPVDSTHNAATGFNLQFSPSGSSAWTIVSGVTSPYTLSGLTAGTAFNVQIQSVNAAGTSAWSPTSTLATAGSSAPNAPSAPTLAQGTGSNLNVTWTAPAINSTNAAATGYNLQYSLSGASTWTAVPGVTSPYTLAGLTAATAYAVQVQGFNASGTGAWSGTSTLTTAGPFVPSAPGALTLAQGTGSNLTVTWTAPAVSSTNSAATGYNLQYSASGASTWTTVSGVSSPYTLAGLSGGAAYNVQVQGSNTAGAGAWSTTSTLTTASTGAPNAPAISSVAPPVDGTNSKLTVTWTAPAVDSTHNAATGYNVRYSPSGAGTWTTALGVTSPYTLTGLNGATAIDFEVQGTNASPTPGAWSGITTGTTWGATVTPTPGGWAAAASQVHNTSVAPSGGVMMTAVAAPTAVTGAAFAWSSSNSTVPTSGLIAALADGQTNGWGQDFNAPATVGNGTYYLWMLAQTGTGSSATTIGAYVTSAITVT
jgi:hypothetical protein